MSPKSSDKMSVSEPKFKQKWTPFSGDSASSDISDFNSFVSNLSKDGKVTTSDISHSNEMLANSGVDRGMCDTIQIGMKRHRESESEFVIVNVLMIFLFCHIS